jgi:hypothetical protein
MRRAIRILAAAVLMVVLMATTVSPAFAAKEECKPFWNDCRGSSTNNGGNIVAAADCGPHGNSFHDRDRTQENDGNCGYG